MQIKFVKILKVIYHLFTKNDLKFTQIISYLYQNEFKQKYFDKSDKENLLLVALDGENVYCPICNHSFITFLPFGINKRANALCPKCNSLERHRLLWLYLFNEKKLLEYDVSKQILHVAPEQPFYDKLKGNSFVEYYPIDKFEGEIMYPSDTQNMDIIDLKFNDNFFDVILCNHVLEHVINDKKAMSEFFRVLKPNGWAILQVPLDSNREITFEDANITDPDERLKYFGQIDHVRIYGLDYKSRLEEVGFKVEIIDYNQSYSKNEKFHYGLPSYENIYLCYKLIPNE